MFDEGTSQCDSLFLTTRKLSSGSTHVSVDRVRQSLDDLGRVGLSKSSEYLLIRGVWVAVEDVLLDTLVEEDWLLSNISDLLSETFEVNASQVLGSNHHIALCRVVVALQQFYGGTLA